MHGSAKEEIMLVFDTEILARGTICGAPNTGSSRGKLSREDKAGKGKGQASVFGLPAPPNQKCDTDRDVPLKKKNKKEEKTKIKTNRFLRNR